MITYCIGSVTENNTFTRIAYVSTAKPWDMNQLRAFLDQVDIRVGIKLKCLVVSPETRATIKDT